MLLRRFTKHINDQNWFAVSLDLLIVVSGIFIGLQVDAWRGTQNERVLEREYLERLLSDMEVSIAAHNYSFDEERVGLEGLDLLSRSLLDRDFREEDEQKIVDGMNYLGWVSRPSTNLITVRELQSTGNISLIQSIEIRKALGQLELSFADALYSAEQTSALFGSTQPQIMLWAYMKPDANEDWGYRVIPDLEQLQSAPEAGKIVSWYAGWMRYHSVLLRKHDEDTVALRDLVEKTLLEMN
jgi:hypothetical protein